MDAPAVPVQSRYIRWLPYWAVLQTDLRQTVRGWVWRTWVLASLAAAVGYLLYRLGVNREAGIIQQASLLVGDLLRWTMFGTGLLVVVLTVGGVSAERHTGRLRAQPRHQPVSVFHGQAALPIVQRRRHVYGTDRRRAPRRPFHGAWGCVVGRWSRGPGGAGVDPGSSGHVRRGGRVATTNPVFGISLLWVVLWAGGFLLSFLPKPYLTPDRVLSKLPQILQGNYNLDARNMVGIGLGAAAVVALVGMIGFSRSDV